MLRRMEEQKRRWTDALASSQHHFNVECTEQRVTKKIGLRVLRIGCVLQLTGFFTGVFTSGSKIS